IELKVLHERAPLFVQLSDGSIQNKYRVKILNKTDKDFHVKITAEGIEGMQLKGAEEPLYARKGNDTSYTLYIKAPSSAIKAERTPITFRATGIEDPTQQAVYESMFFAPR
ncbi:MAG TPA: cytochrome c oxidase accessory protein CcoG, partial [Thiotrichales bacterium]|nr:cytochrome c oxidase accessory protein CcoG [Thiotrichales bacterium]